MGILKLFYQQKAYLPNVVIYPFVFFLKQKIFIRYATMLFRNKLKNLLILEVTMLRRNRFNSLSNLSVSNTKNKSFTFIMF